MVSPRDGTGAINDRISGLSAGDTLLFGPGVYKGPFRMKGINGLPNHPVVILGSSEGIEPVIIDGRAQPGTDLFNNAVGYSAIDSFGNVKHGTPNKDFRAKVPIIGLPPEWGLSMALLCSTCLRSIGVMEYWENEIPAPIFCKLEQKPSRFFNA